MKAIINGIIILPDELVTGQVLMYDDKISQIIPRSEWHAGWCTDLINAQGGFVSPGFINEHIHGCAGCDTMDESPEALLTMSKALPATGVTAFVPTTMTYEQGRVEQVLAAVRNACTQAKGARILGAHMEGPFISTAYKGAQKDDNIVKPDFSWLAPYKDVIKIITLAPEVIPSHHFLRECEENGIILSFGHSGADYDQALEAMAGVESCHVSHLFNAMSPLHHRAPGLAGAALTQDDVHCELICDNIHVHPAMQKLVYKAKGRDGIILITDSMRACLLGDGESELGGQKVFVQNGQARLADGSLAGSVLTMDQAVMNFLGNTGASLPDTIAMATINPAKDLGVYDRMGSLEAGKNADFTIFDETGKITYTVIGGETVFDWFKEEEKRERAEKD